MTSREYPGSKVVGRILALPRVMKMLIAGIMALATTLAVSPIVDEIYIRFFYTRSTIIAPSLVSAGIGFVMYSIGWQLIVGTIGEQPDNQPSILGYLLIGLLALTLVGVWFVRLIVFGNASISG